MVKLSESSSELVSERAKGTSKRVDKTGFPVDIADLELGVPQFMGRYHQLFPR